MTAQNGGLRSRKKTNKANKVSKEGSGSVDKDPKSSDLSNGTSDLFIKAKGVGLEKRASYSSERDDDRRSGGDGESIPDTPPNEIADNDLLPSLKETSLKSHHTHVSEAVSRTTSNTFVVTINVDIMAVLLFAVGAVSRMIFLDHPRNVVFDEMHYGKYAAMYAKRNFFFDGSPPLGKLLIALAGYLAGFDGDFDFTKIGSPYPESVPLWSLRFIPALCGSLLTPTVYLILCELGLHHWAGALAGILVIFDTALLTQSRYILLESMMILFALWALLSVLKLRRYHSAPFSAKWWMWITLASINIGCALSVKYLAVYSCWLCCAVLLRDFWDRLGNRQISNWQLFKEFVTQCAFVAVIPIAIYIGSFYVHLSILTKAGIHDTYMTSAFQASLEGGLSSIIKGQPLEIAHGSQITLRPTHGKNCWLHSHENVYPVKYEDGRGSSHQQQVTCYGFKDVNNWWIVKRPEREDLAVEEPVDVVRHGDIIQLVHGMTHRALNSHDVAGPMSPNCQEVSCYINYNISMDSENLWRVDIINGVPDKDDKPAVWTSIGSQVRLIHATTGAALKFSLKLLPEWGFFQNEVVADRSTDQLETIWNVEEHRYTKNDEDKRTLERELFSHELIPEKPTHLSFIEKFFELQLKMLLIDQENVQNHNYASGPLDWLFLTRGIAYFVSKESNAQIHLLGNIWIWYAGTLSVGCYCALLIFYLMRRQRLCYDVPDDVFQRFVKNGEVLFGGYLFHFLPYFFYDRTLFLHHYLTAYVFKIMITAFMANHTFELIRLFCPKYPSMRKIFAFFVIVWLCGAVLVFKSFCVLSYGFFPLTASEVKELEWMETWNFIVHKP